jgi:hypothetical protein
MKLKIRQGTRTPKITSPTRTPKTKLNGPNVLRAKKLHDPEASAANNKLLKRRLGKGVHIA